MHSNASYFPRTFIELLRDYRVSLKILLLSLIGLIAFGTRLFSVIRFESVIHEFDPWFNFRATQYLVDNGWYKFLNWMDERSWYPLGRVVGTTVYPGLMITSAFIHYILNIVLAIKVDIRDICVFLAPVFSGLTALATFLLTKELADDSAGLLAAAFMAIVPGYISRSVAGSYDNEAISITLMMTTFYLWIKAVKHGSALFAMLSAAVYYYMVASWGGYMFITNLIPLHVFSLLVAGRYTHRLYVAYCTWYVLGALSAMTVAFVNISPTKASEHMASIGIFCLLQVVAFMSVIKGHLDSRQFRLLARVAVIVVFLSLFGGFAAMGAAGKIPPWAGRFISLWDTGYAKKHNPIIASVSEHQPTTWSSFFFDLNMLLFAAPAGLFFCFLHGTDEHIFAIVYAITASYFAAVMVRLILTLAPILCVLGAIGLAKVIQTILSYSSSPRSPSALKTNSANGLPFDVKLVSLGTMAAILVYFAWHCTWVTMNAYSSPSIMLSAPDPTNPSKTKIIDDFREAFYWLRRNTHSDAKVLAWWDYGYQLAGMSDRITMVDNNTWNTTHIAMVGKALTLPEEKAYPVLRQLEADYILVLNGVLSGFSGDDLNKLYWIIRITAGEFPNEVREADYFGPGGEFQLDAGAPPAMRNSLIYKMSYANMGVLMGAQAMDRARGLPLRGIDPKLTSVSEAYTTENFIIRIFKVHRPDPLGRSLFA